MRGRMWSCVWRIAKPPQCGSRQTSGPVLHLLDLSPDNTRGQHLHFATLQIHRNFIVIFLSEERVETFNLFVWFEYFLDEPLNAHQEQSWDEEDVGEVDGKFAQIFVSAESLDVPHVMARVVWGRRETPALFFFSAKVAEQRSAGGETSRNIASQHYTGDRLRAPLYITITVSSWWHNVTAVPVEYSGGSNDQSEHYQTINNVVPGWTILSLSQ